ncbi:MAG TPA: guanylate kinase [Gemmatimonadaceae bacterium]|nr:guanylate kinase [Gemmatimonadaceae bacterium]
MTSFPVILSAPSGGGKTTIARRLLQTRSDVGYSVSCTTRSPREGEVDGKDYHFLSRENFLEARSRGDFAESAEVHGNWYGTLRSEVDRVLRAGKHVLMDIDVQGAAQFYKAYPASVLIFVLPPSADALLQRLRLRNTESRTSLAARMRSALQELLAVPWYQYVVVNDDLDRAVANVGRIIDAETLRRERLHNLEDDVRRILDRLEHELSAEKASDDTTLKR